VTRFGELRVERKLYRDEEGNPRFPLDEALGWRPRQAATPGVQEAVVALAADLSFEHIARLTAGVLSKSTVWRLVQRVGREALEADEALRRAVYEEGALPPPGPRRVRRLYVEADGIWVRLQRDRKRWMEMLVGMAYEGWERLGSEERPRYRLKHKRVYVHGGSRKAFWEGAAVAWWRIWDLSQVEQVVVNGDDAEWIGQVTALWDRVVRQQDGFHLARTCCRAFGKKEGKAVYAAIRAGQWEKAEAISRRHGPASGERAQQAWTWLQRHWGDETLVDWRHRVGEEEAQERGLGCMEGTLAHLLARRMKKKGRSWSRQGAQVMGKVQELVFHQELGLWCRRRSPVPPRKAAAFPSRSRPRRKGSDNTWLQAHLPALQGRFPTDPALLRLRERLRLN